MIRSMDSTTVHAYTDDTRVNIDLHDAESAAAAAAPLLSPPPPRPKSVSSIADDVRRFRASLKWCALDHSSRASRAASYLAFLLLGLAVPLASSFYTRGGSGVATYRVTQVPESALAGIAFFTLSAFYRRAAAGSPGLRHLLLLDGLRDDAPTVRHAYARELDRAFRYLAYILLPCFAVELAHKIIFFSTTSVQVHLPFPPRKLPVAPAMLVAVLAAWVYRTLVFLFVCVLFRLTCELQILRLEEFRKGLEQGIESDAWVIFLEHSRIRKQLLVTSHRYRIFIIGCLVTISITQLGALMLVLSPKSHKNFFNSGDLVVCSVVQISGFFMCLIGATRITHRAHGIVAIATKWHMLITRAASNALLLKSGSPGTAQTPPCPTTPTSHDDYDCCVNDNSDAQLATAAFQNREALVNYLQHNRGGITLFGFVLDRGLLQALFVFEMTLVLWILSKVIVI